MPGARLKLDAAFAAAVALDCPAEEPPPPAHAGRAQARLQLGEYQAALDDAKLVPNDYVLYVPMDFSKGGNTNQRNHVFWANSDTPYRSWTVNYTFYHSYYAETGDPRTPWQEFSTPSSRVCSWTFMVSVLTMPRTAMTTDQAAPELEALLRPGIPADVISQAVRQGPGPDRGVERNLVGLRERPVGGEHPRHRKHRTEQQSAAQQGRTKSTHVWCLGT